MRMQSTNAFQYERAGRGASGLVLIGPTTGLSRDHRCLAPVQIVGGMCVSPGRSPGEREEMPAGDQLTPGHSSGSHLWLLLPLTMRHYQATLAPKPPEPAQSSVSYCAARRRRWRLSCAALSLTAQAPLCPDQQQLTPTRPHSSSSSNRAASQDEYLQVSSDRRAAGGAVRGGRPHCLPSLARVPDCCRLPDPSCTQAIWRHDALAVHRSTAAQNHGHKVV